MMDMMIQDPTYASSMRLGEVLIDACTKGCDGAGAFAFVEENGIDLLLGDAVFSKYIKKYKYELVVGTDSITDQKAIDRLRAYCKSFSNLSVYGYVHDTRKFLFHPKVAWFKTATGGLSIIGSGNLTERGLYHNVEMYAYNELGSSDFNKLKSDWDSWMNYSIANNFLFAIDDPIIDHAVNLSAAKKASTTSGPVSSGGMSGAILPSTELSTLYGKQPKVTSKKKPSSVLISTTSRAKPNKANKVIGTSTIPAVTPIHVAPSINPIWTVTSSDRVLVAEVPKSKKRWKQINFDKVSFQDYFGATPGVTGGTYRILLRSVDAAGKLGATESRPSVSVKSHNWRFEISAASGMAYPVGSQRPYVVFSEVTTRSFLYELIMPGDSRYSDVDLYVKAWKSAKGVKRLARIITDVSSIKPLTPNLGLWKV